VYNAHLQLQATIRIGPPRSSGMESAFFHEYIAASLPPEKRWPKPAPRAGGMPEDLDSDAIDEPSANAPETGHPPYP